MPCSCSQCRLSSAADPAAGSNRGGTAAGHPQPLPASGSGQPASDAPAVAPLGPRLPSHSADHGHVAARPAHPDSGTAVQSGPQYSVHRSGNANAAVDSSNVHHGSQRAARSSGGSDSTALGQQSQQQGVSTVSRSRSGDPAPRTPSSALPSRAPPRSAADRIMSCLAQVLAHDPGLPSCRGARGHRFHDDGALLSCSVRCGLKGS